MAWRSGLVVVASIVIATPAWADAPSVAAPPAPEDASVATEPALQEAPPPTEGLAPFPLQPTVLSEIDYRVFPSEVEGNTGFAVARFRPGVVLNPAPWFQAVGTVEFAGEYAIILDAFMKLRATDWADLLVGYSKPPLFASFVYEPVHSLSFPDRAPVVTSFRVRRDVGAAVHVAPGRVPLEGWLRIGNGSGSPLGNDNALPAGYASLDLVLGRAWTSNHAIDRRYGLRLGAGGLIESVRDRDGISGQTPLGFVYFRPVVVSGLRVVGESHAVAYAGPLRLSIEGALARESRSRDTDGNPSTPRVTRPTMSSYGVTTELSCVLVGDARSVGQAPRGRHGAGGAWQGGALEVALRYDGMWLGRGADDVNAGGSHGGAAAMKWWPVDFMAAALSGYIMHYDVAPIEEPNQLWSWGTIARASFFWGLPGQQDQHSNEEQ